MDKGERADGIVGVGVGGGEGEAKRHVSHVQMTFFVKVRLRHVVWMVGTAFDLDWVGLGESWGMGEFWVEVGEWVNFGWKYGVWVDLR